MSREILDTKYTVEKVNTEKFSTEELKYGMSTES